MNSRRKALKSLITLPLAGGIVSSNELLANENQIVIDS